uniref:Uncharacterized protein n=2 Tax=Clastoptera arizonana TaxID=38151 RepID=A0A1B6D4B0_9HEMI
MKNFSLLNQKSRDRCTQEFIDIYNPDNEDDMNNLSFYNAMRKVTMCATECVFKEANLLELDGTLKEKAVEDYFIRILFNNDWTFAQTALNICLKERSESYEKENQLLLCGTEDSMCNHESFSFLFVCLVLEIEKECPDTMKTQDSICIDFFKDVKNESFIENQIQIYCNDSSIDYDMER